MNYKRIDAGQRQAAQRTTLALQDRERLLVQEWEARRLELLIELQAGTAADTKALQAACDSVKKEIAKAQWQSAISAKAAKLSRKVLKELETDILDALMVRLEEAHASVSVDEERVRQEHDLTKDLESRVELAEALKGIELTKTVLEKLHNECSARFDKLGGDHPLELV